MTQDKSSAGEADAQENGAEEGNPFGGSPTFPNPSSARSTGDTTGFNGSYEETEHHTQHEYDAEHQHPDAGTDSNGTDLNTGEQKD